MSRRPRVFEILQAMIPSFQWLPYRNGNECVSELLASGSFESKGKAKPVPSLLFKPRLVASGKMPHDHFWYSHVRHEISGNFPISAWVVLVVLVAHLRDWILVTNKPFELTLSPVKKLSTRSVSVCLHTLYTGLVSGRALKQNVQLVQIYHLLSSFDILMCFGDWQQKIEGACNSKYSARVCIVIDAPVDVSWQDFVPASIAQNPSGVYLTQRLLAWPCCQRHENKRYYVSWSAAGPQNLSSSFNMFPFHHFKDMTFEKVCSSRSKCSPWVNFLWKVPERRANFTTYHDPLVLKLVSPHKTSGEE